MGDNKTIILIKMFIIYEDYIIELTKNKGE